VRDVDDTDPVGPQPPDGGKEEVALVLGQRCRGLVEDEDARRGGDRTGNGHKLAGRHRQLAQRGVGVDRDAEAAEQPAGLLPHPAPVDQPEPAHRLPAEEDVLGDAEIGLERQLLVDDGDAQRLRVARARHSHRLAAEPHGAGVRPVHAAEDLDQRALAGPVLAQERMHLARTQLEAYLLERPHTGK
jgi:hypothetical protein